MAKKTAWSLAALSSALLLSTALQVAANPECGDGITDCKTAPEAFQIEPKIYDSGGSTAGSVGRGAPLKLPNFPPELLKELGKEKCPPGSSRGCQPPPDLRSRPPTEEKQVN